MDDTKIKLAKAIHLSMKLREESFDKAGYEKSIANSAYANAGKFYKISYGDACEKACEQVGLDIDIAFIVYLAADAWWNDANDWATRILSASRGELVARVESLVKEGRKIQAIKEWRQETGVRLSEAKAFADSFDQTRGLVRLAKKFRAMIPAKMSLHMPKEISDEVGKRSDEFEFIMQSQGYERNSFDAWERKGD